MDKILGILKRVALLKSVSRLVEWDQETYMPKGAFLFRGEQIELLSGMIHKEKTSSSYKKALNALIDLETGVVKKKKATFVEKRLLQLLRTDFIKESALPVAFVKNFAKLTSESMTVWAKAKKENDFSLFAPYLEKILAMTRDKIGYLGFDDHPYDALLDDFDPGRRTKEVEKLFKELSATLTPLINKIASKKKEFPSEIAHEKQMAFGKKVLETIGFDFERGRLDLSNHPFSSTFHPTDSRITTKTGALTESLFAIIHEAGHSFYEMGMDESAFGTPLCEPISLSIHESQSRLWETYIGKSKPFWQYFYPILKKEAKGPFEKMTLEAFYKEINRVTPSFIRIEADEVTYSLHVILRFELEKGLITGDLKVKELPAAWNALMKKYLGITPPKDSLGCLQDIHWSMGAFGYFPTYALGNLFAAQFYDAYKKENPLYAKEIASGNFTSLKDFLKKNIYQYGRLYSGEELLKKLGEGNKLTTAPYFKYLKDKFSN